MNDVLPLPKLAFTIREVVESTGIGRSALYEEIKAGHLIARKRGSATIILTGDLSDYLNSLPVCVKEEMQ